jgi:hypothetical protein
MSLKHTDSQTDGASSKDAGNGMARRMRIIELKEQVQRSDYVVDPHVVAEALLRHTDARHSLADALGLSPLGARIPSPRAPRKHPGS